jgi:hypothetical protein
MTTLQREVAPASSEPTDFEAGDGGAQLWVPDVKGLEWSGPAQRGCVEADPFVMWVAISFVTIVVILYFFLRGVKKPSHGKPTTDKSG